jgi:hypothetical protein
MPNGCLLYFYKAIETTLTRQGLDYEPIAANHSAAK